MMGNSKDSIAQYNSFPNNQKKERLQKANLLQGSTIFSYRLPSSFIPSVSSQTRGPSHLCENTLKGSIKNV